jgi:hypothetical protein
MFFVWTQGMITVSCLRQGRGWMDAFCDSMCLTAGRCGRPAAVPIRAMIAGRAYVARRAAA